MRAARTMTNDSILQWLEQWYQSECNGDWEHSFGVKIETLDNPGWSVQIDLQETSLQGLVVPFQKADISEYDWFTFEVGKGKYTAYGDPTKLSLLLEKFREIVAQNVK
jgi:hypothetical protein